MIPPLPVMSTATSMEELAVPRSALQPPASTSSFAPRTSVIVLLSGSEPISPEGLAERVAAVHDGRANVIVACAGRPVNLPALQRTVASVEFLLAPPGTSSEDLRELAMRRAPGDIVRLLDGVQRGLTIADDEITMAAM